uniref:Uncharacterized protein n=1 Tax=Vespula pensylvanica TaxID=30213 RepID=A0A834N529_VESPE|nr:hypothetical protein H0235_016632 [Vespula pensylvanica]
MKSIRNVVVKVVGSKGVLKGVEEKEDGIARHDMAWYGMVWYGMVWYGMVWYGMVWYGIVHGMASHHVTSLDTSVLLPYQLKLLALGSLIYRATLIANTRLKPLRTRIIWWCEKNQ